MEIDGIETGRSRRGNWWCRLADGRCVTVFRRHDGLYGWCLADGKGEPRFSRCGFESEAEAVDAVACRLAPVSFPCTEPAHGPAPDRRGSGRRVCSPASTCRSRHRFSTD
jgi:hypothetical protein